MEKKEKAPWNKGLAVGQMHPLTIEQVIVEAMGDSIPNPLHGSLRVAFVAGRVGISKRSEPSPQELIFRATLETDLDV